MSRTTLFLTNKSQAVLLNKDVAFPKGCARSRCCGTDRAG